MHVMLCDYARAIWFASQWGLRSHSIRHADITGWWKNTCEQGHLTLPLEICVCKMLEGPTSYIGDHPNRKNGKLAEV